jgi:transcription initiation factor TFIIIB Brf1 subunit/transcription initiation factor TFIIB
MTVGHIINKRAVPEECPKCGSKPLKVRVEDYDRVWHDGNIVCAKCGQFIRSYDAG